MNRRNQSNAAWDALLRAVRASFLAAPVLLVGSAVAQEPFGPPPGMGPMPYRGQAPMLPPGGAVFPPAAPIAPGPFGAVPPPRRLRDYSWIYIDSLAPRQVKVHDILTVVVNESAEVIQNSRFDRQRNATFKIDLKSFIRLGEENQLRPAALDNPKIDSQMRNTFNSLGNATSTEGMKYRIAATVVDVLPNGTLVLEARKTIQTNGELWEYRLTGQVRSEDVQANNTVLTEHVANLNIVKQEHGKIRDSTERNWFMRLYDKVGPF